MTVYKGHILTVNANDDTAEYLVEDGGRMIPRRFRIHAADYSTRTVAKRESLGARHTD